MSSSTEKETENSLQVTDEIVKDFIREVLKLEQESLYIKKHGLKDNIVAEVKKRIK